MPGDRTTFWNSGANAHPTGRCADEHERTSEHAAVPDNHEHDGRHSRDWRRSPLTALAVCGASYAYGSIPLIYLLGKRRAVDLRSVGSGNVGATNLVEGGAHVLGVLGWLFDVSKGYLPVVGARRLGLREDVAALAGVCGVAGQCWPIFLRFRGGRGISAFVGATASLVGWRAWALTMAPLAGGGLWHVVGQRLARSGGGRSRSVPFGCFLGVIAFPLIARVRTRHITTRPQNARHTGRGTWIASLFLSAVILVRRLTAPLPDDALVGPTRRPEAVLFRLLYDRNTDK